MEVDINASYKVESNTYAIELYELNCITAVVLIIYIHKTWYRVSIKSIDVQWYENMHW